MINKSKTYIFDEAKFTHKNTMQYLSKYDGEYFSGNAFDFALYNNILPVSHHYLINYGYPLDESSDKFRRLFGRNILNLRIIYEATPYTNQLIDKADNNTGQEKKLKPLSINIAAAKFAAQITITGAIMFGNICFVIIL